VVAILRVKATSLNYALDPEDRARPLKLWLVGVSGLPFGIYSGFIVTSLPFLLARIGTDVNRIATISAVALSPTIWSFAVSPLIDMGLTRRVYVLITSVVAGACLVVSVYSLSVIGSGSSVSSLIVPISVVVLGNLSIVLFVNAWSGWMADLIPDKERGQISGYLMAANLGGGAIGALITLKTLQYSVLLSALTTGVMVVAPALVVLTFPDAIKPPPVSLKAFEQLRRNISTIVSTRRFLLGFIFFLSPVSCAAAINLFSALGKDFSAGEDFVIWLTGAGCAAAGSAGAFLGGIIADRIDRQMAYVGAGIAAAASGLILLFGPHKSIPFAFGVLLYTLVAGICYSAFQALALELVGADNPVASTQYSLFLAASNAAIVYMTWIDGRAYKYLGVKGLFAVDAGASILAGFVFLFLLREKFASPVIATKPEP
jgi:MFS transporter, PAT family, beta-lactamase induction signal transducer AmpG